MSHPYTSQSRDVGMRKIEELRHQLKEEEQKTECLRSQRDRFLSLLQRAEDVMREHDFRELYPVLMDDIQDQMISARRGDEP